MIYILYARTLGALVIQAIFADLARPVEPLNGLHQLGAQKASDVGAARKWPPY